MTNTIKANEVKPGMIVVIGEAKVGVRSVNANGAKVYLMTESWDTHAIPKDDVLILISRGIK